MNRIKQLFETKKNRILSVYFTAGYPKRNNTVSIIEHLVYSGADLIEIGMPFSDPLADGPTIQASSTKALENGMTIQLLFEQIEDIRKEVDIPLILMGYLNPVYQYGIENFLKKCKEIGVDGVIIPDLPMREYETTYRQYFEENNIQNIFLITPQTSEERVRKIDELTNSFIYVVSASATTGAKSSFSETQKAYFKKIKEMKLKNPTLIGFGISNNESFEEACKYSNGVIIGSAFIKAISQEGELKSNTKNFVESILKA